jgi:predicted nucleic acid-binding protein
MDAFDADVLIYAAKGDVSAEQIRQLLMRGSPAGVGSVLLLPELLSNPKLHGKLAEYAALRRALSRLVLVPVTESTSWIAMRLRARYALKTVDAVHLASALEAGADRFITNNRQDFGKDITEIDVTYPEDLR